MRRWLREVTGGLPRQFWFLWAGTLVNRAGAFVVIYLAIYLTVERGFSQTQAGLIIGLYGVGGALGTLAGGVLADRWGRRATLLTAHFGATALMLVLGFARDYRHIAAATLVLAVFAEAARPAFAAMMVDVVPARDRLRAFSLNYWAINLGFAVAAIVAGFAAEIDYLLLFIGDAFTTLVTAVLLLVVLVETRPAAARPPAGPQTGAGAAGTGPGPGLDGAAATLEAVAGSRGRTRPAGLSAVFADRVFIGYLLLNLGAVLVMFQHMSSLPIAMSADGLSPATFGAVIAVNGVLIVAGQLFVPRLVQGRGHSPVLALGTLIVGIGFGLTAFADTAVMFAATVVIWTLGEMLQSPATSALLADLAPAALRGRYQGVSSLSYAVGSALAPVLGALVLERAGDGVLWAGCAVLGAVSALGHLLAGPARERRAAALRAVEQPECSRT